MASNDGKNIEAGTTKLLHMVVVVLCHFPLTVQCLVRSFDVWRSCLLSGLVEC